MLSEILIIMGTILGLRDFLSGKGRKHNNYAKINAKLKCTLDSPLD